MADTATRYSGRATIRCRYIEPTTQSTNRNGKYRCTISVGGRRVSEQMVGAPNYLRHAVDSPIAFDDAARAACAFASMDGHLDDGQLDYDGMGIAVQRRR
ncbi:MAG: hypothetical protein Q8S13_02675 [Dehalococcoidia bacterium]|nr:hypothetical protein [Dehalococcoidia bacterium]